MTVLSRTLMKPVAALAMLVLALSLPVAAAEDSSRIDSWSFRVFLDDKPIGSHDFELARLGDESVLTTRAEFEVRFLFITAFRYQHENVETWRGDCLRDIRAQTDNNGESLEVEGMAEGGQFRLVANDAATELPGCVKTFAYWNPAILESKRLLNSQTGEYEAVEVEFEGKEQLRISGEAVASNRYAMTTKGGKIRLWYSATDERWLALEAPAKGGRLIRYEPVRVPAAVQVARSD